MGKQIRTGVRTLLFDLGGVIVKLGGMEDLRNWVHPPLPDETIWAHWLCSPSVRAFESGQCDTLSFANALIDEMKLSVAAPPFIKTFTNWPRKLFPGVKSTLKQLRTQYTLVSLSNTNALHWPRLVNEMGIGNLFDHHFPSHLTGNIKPDPEAFTQVVTFLGHPPDSILFFDDNKINVIAARMCGLQAITVDNFESAQKAIANLKLL